MRNRTWNFEEEKKPCGDDHKLSADRLTYNKSTDLSGLLASRVESHPWFLIIWERLPVICPPMKEAMVGNIYAVGTKPYCCYLRTVIFHKYPYRGKQGHAFDEWGRVETRLSQDDIVSFEGEQFKLGPGQVVFEQDAWWMLHWARRENKS